jgi:hypothetical protein
MNVEEYSFPNLDSTSIFTDNPNNHTDYLLPSTSNQNLQSNLVLSHFSDIESTEIEPLSLEDDSLQVIRHLRKIIKLW